MFSLSKVMYIERTKGFTKYNKTNLTIRPIHLTRFRKVYNCDIVCFYLKLYVYIYFIKSYVTFKINLNIEVIKPTLIDTHRSDSRSIIRFQVMKMSYGSGHRHYEILVILHAS